MLRFVAIGATLGLINIQSTVISHPLLLHCALAHQTHSVLVLHSKPVVTVQIHVCHGIFVGNLRELAVLETHVYTVEFLLRGNCGLAGVGNVVLGVSLLAQLYLLRHILVLDLQVFELSLEFVYLGFHSFTLLNLVISVSLEQRKLFLNLFHFKLEFGVCIIVKFLLLLKLFDFSFEVVHVNFHLVLESDVTPDVCL